MKRDTSPQAFATRTIHAGQSPEPVGNATAATVDVIELIKHFGTTLAVAVFAELLRVSHVDDDAVDATRDDSQYENESERMNVPCKLEAAVKEHDDDECESEVDMCGQPTLHTA